MFVLAICWMATSPVVRSHPHPRPLATGAFTPEVNRALQRVRDGADDRERIVGLQELRLIAVQRHRDFPNRTPQQIREWLIEANLVTSHLVRATSTERPLWIRTAAVYAIGDWAVLGNTFPKVWLRRHANATGTQSEAVFREACRTALERAKND